MRNGYTVLIVGDEYMDPQVIERVIRETLDQELLQRLSFQSIKLPYPVDYFELNPSTKVPSGMSWSDPSDHRYVKGISEYYGPPDSLKGKIKNADILIVHGAPLPGYVLKEAKKLKLICSLRGGPKNIDIRTAKSLGMRIVNTPGKNARAVAEYTLGALLSLTRNIVRGNKCFDRKIWCCGLFKWSNCGIELKDKVIGLIGFGHIAKSFVELLKGFSLRRILVYDPFQPQDILLTYQVVPASLEEIYEQSDIISLHARLNESSKNILNSHAFELMQRKPIIINTARGGLMDYMALKRALLQGKVSGAVLDVFGNDPFKEYEDLCSLPNVICTPHIAGGSRETVIRAAKMVAEEIRRFILNLPFLNEL